MLAMARMSGREGGMRRRQRKRDLGDFKALARERGGKCLSKRYRNPLVALRWQCAEGHAWEARPGNLLYRGTWCPTCSSVEGNPWAVARSDRWKDVPEPAEPGWEDEVALFEARSSVRSDRLGHPDPEFLYGWDALGAREPVDLHEIEVAHDRNRLVTAIVKRLRPRLRDLVTRIFGLGGANPMSIPAIAEEEGVSPGRIAALLRSALHSLRRHAKISESIEELRLRGRGVRTSSASRRVTQRTAPTRTLPTRTAPLVIRVPEIVAPAPPVPISRLSDTGCRMAEVEIREVGVPLVAPGATADRWLDRGGDHVRARVPLRDDHGGVSLTWVEAGSRNARRVMLETPLDPIDIVESSDWYEELRVHRLHDNASAGNVSLAVSRLAGCAYVLVHDSAGSHLTGFRVLEGMLEMSFEAECPRSARLLTDARSEHAAILHGEAPNLALLGPDPPSFR